MAEPFHYPPEVFELLVKTIPLLSKSKKGVILFMQGAGVAGSDLSEVTKIVHNNPDIINKYEITRNVLTKVNARGDNGLRARREIIKRVVEFQDFSLCWPSDQYPAKGLVASLREIINVKDSFTRMKQERESERLEKATKRKAEQTAATDKRIKIESINSRLSGLFALNDKPQERGKLLESILNDLFRVYNIHVHEDFRHKCPDNSLLLEQIDGVIELNGTTYLVEMKWLKVAVGVESISQHLVRLFGRANAHGIFIAANGYTEPAIKQCRDALSQKTIILCSLHEIIMLLNRQDDLITLLKKKYQSAIVDKNPYHEILT
ncbi:restriction endonuclease [Legionella israelensis]|uniref:restriction endonuclease n=1 Tax=Legionella israelensis TaxID=454 RepID=UPI00117C69D3|nr:restriction endonuclease [Legionella israelensis]QDP71540.1 restriction endonuclease [Legionella israelensis]